MHNVENNVCYCTQYFISQLSILNPLGDFLGENSLMQLANGGQKKVGTKHCHYLTLLLPRHL